MSLTYAYTNINGTVTGINDLGQVAGWAGPAGGGWFIYGDDAYTNLPRRAAIQVSSDINDQGEVVGWGHLAGVGSDFGLFYSTGSLTKLNDPNAELTELQGINNSGDIVGISGSYGGGVQGFLYQNGTFSTLDDPASVRLFPQDINNNEQIVGYYFEPIDGSTAAHGFLYISGTYTTLDAPLAGSGTYLNGPNGTTQYGGTYLTGINDTGQIVGYYVNASGQHGFLYNAGTFYTVDNPLGFGGTYLTGINDYGQIVGNYLDSAGISHGFLGNLAFSAKVAGATVYTAEYGFAPDVAQLNVLIEFTIPQYTYAQDIGVLDPTIYAFEALGVTLASTATLFQDTYGPTNSIYPNSPDGDAQFAADAYLDVFGRAATSAQVQHFINQLNFFETLYTAAGVFGSAENIDLLARGAIYGQMLGHQAELDPFGPGGMAGTVPLVGMSAATDTMDFA